MADEPMVRTHGVKCEWCGADVGESCNLQPGGPLVFGEVVHDVRVLPKSEHDAYVAQRGV